jgi:hypothetical protein
MNKIVNTWKKNILLKKNELYSYNVKRL